MNFCQLSSGGRHITDIERIFLEVIDGHIAGDPMNEKTRWLKLTRAEVCEKMLAFDIKISRNIVRKLMKKSENATKTAHRAEQ